MAGCCFFEGHYAAHTTDEVSKSTRLFQGCVMTQPSCSCDVWMEKPVGLKAEGLPHPVEDPTKPPMRLRLCCGLGGRRRCGRGGW